VVAGVAEQSDHVGAKTRIFTPMSNQLKSAYLKITVHYILICLAGWLLFEFAPGFIEYLPVGTSERLFTSGDDAYELEPVTVHGGRLEGESQWAHGLFFLICFLSAILLAVPVGWVYLGTPTSERTDAFIARAIIILPIAVTGLVLIVQNSLALAFSLAGIVAGTGIRFRTNMKEFTDTMYFLTVIGIGLAAGVGSLGLSLIMSIIFCYTVLILTTNEYGGRESLKEKKKNWKD